MNKLVLQDLILKNRSYRRFHQEQAVSRSMLKDLVNLARLSPSGKNLQPLKYSISASPEVNERIFACLSWGAYLKEWGGPAEGERPAAYIVTLGDREISATFGVDHGIAANNILLGAVERGYGGCMLGTINRDKLRAVLSLPEHYEILLTIALGKPKEDIHVDQAPVAGDIKYWRDKAQIHHVPKRSIDEIIIQSY